MVGRTCAGWNAQPGLIRIEFGSHARFLALQVRCIQNSPAITDNHIIMMTRTARKSGTGHYLANRWFDPGFTLA